MKKNKLLLALVGFFVLGMTNISIAQYDDLYYNPDTDAGYYNSSNSSNSDSYASNDRDNDNDYDDEAYQDYNDYDDYNYYYSSRIRRFHRPYYGFSYFDPVYVDQAYYDPFWTPGVTVLIYDNYNPWRSSYNRWNNSWGGSRFFVSNSYGSPWGWNNGYYGGGFGNTYVTNNYYGNGYGGGYGNYGGGYGGYSNYYCPPSWGNGNSYNTVSNNNPANTATTVQGKPAPVAPAMPALVAEIQVAVVLTMEMKPPVLQSQPTTQLPAGKPSGTNFAGN